MYCGTFLNSLTTWSGLFLVVPLNFMLPCALFLLQDHEVAPKAPKGGYGAIELTGDGGEGGGNGDGCLSFHGASSLPELNQFQARRAFKVIFFGSENGRPERPVRA